MTSQPKIRSQTGERFFLPLVVRQLRLGRRATSEEAWTKNVKPPDAVKKAERRGLVHSAGTMKTTQGTNHIAEATRTWADRGGHEVCRGRNTKVGRSEHESRRDGKGGIDGERSGQMRRPSGPMEPRRTRQLCVCGPATERVVWELNPAVRHFEPTPTCGELEPPEFFGHGLQTLMTRATVEDGPDISYGVLCWVTPSWRLGAVHEFTGTSPASRNSRSGHEKGGRCRPGSLALVVGQLLLIHTP